MTKLTLTSDELDVVVLPDAGARVHSIHAFGHLLTRTPPDATTHHLNPFFWGGYHMLPWCNRVERGPYSVLGQPFAVPSNFADGSAIHGLHYVTPWEPDGPASFRCEGDGAGTGWPWTYTATVAYAVAGPVLTIAYALTNTSPNTMPAGIGFHPWFREPTSLRIPSGLVFPDNTDTAVRPDPAEGALDLRGGGPLVVGTDACWVDLDAPAVTLSWADLGVSLTLAADDPQIIAVAANPPDVDGVAVELQTHAPAGIRRLLGAEPYGLHPLAAGDTLAITLSLTATQP